MSFEILSKAELTDLVEKKIGSKPSSTLSKAQLIDILEAEEIPVVGTEAETDLPIGEGLQLPGSELPPVETGDILEAEDEGLIKIVKLGDDGQVIDSSSTSKDAWALLPDHKYGWTIAPPKEIA